MEKKKEGKIVEHLQIIANVLTVAGIILATIVCFWRIFMAPEWGQKLLAVSMLVPIWLGVFNMGTVLSFMTYLKHQKFLPCPRMFSNSLCHAWRPLDVSDPHRSFNRQCEMGADKIGVALV